MVNRLIAVGVVASILSLGLGEFRRQAVEKALLEASVGRLEQQRDLLSRYSDSVERNLKVREQDFNSQAERYRRLANAYRASRAAAPGPTIGDDYEDADEVEQIIVAGEGAVRSCQSLVMTCRAAMEIKNDLIANQDSTIRALKLLQPSRTQKVTSTAIKVGLGIIIGLVIK